MNGMKGCSSFSMPVSTYSSTRSAPSLASASPEFRRSFVSSIYQSQ